MASLAAQAVASGTTQKPVAAAKTSASGGVDAVFASLLAKPSAAPSDAKAGHVKTGDAPNDEAQNSASTTLVAQSVAAKNAQTGGAQPLSKLAKTKSTIDDASGDAANPALAALAVQTNVAQPAAAVASKSAASAVEALALQKLAKKSGTPGDGSVPPQFKAGTPTLPVITPGGAQAEVAKQTGAATGTAPSATADQTKDAAVLSNGAQQTARQGAPVQVTESQALSIHFDASATKSGDGQTQNGHTGSQTGGGSAHGRGQNADAPAPQISQATSAVQAAPPVTASTAPAASGAAADIASAATAAGVTGPSTSSNAAAILHVAPQSNSTAATAAQPNLDALAVTIAAKSTDGSKQFDIRLDPPELGRIDVRLSVDDSGKAQAHLAADNVQTLQLLQRDSATLERSLRDAGLDLANNGLNFSLKGQERQDSDTPKAQSHGRALSVTAVAAPAISNSSYSLAPDGVTLDIRV